MSLTLGTTATPQQDAQAVLFPDGAVLTHLLDAGLDGGTERVAISAPGRLLTFGEIDAGARRLAACLKHHHGVKHGDRIVVFAEKDPYLVSLAFAIWLVGGIYVPIDQKTPALRFQSIKESLRPAMVIASEAQFHRLGGEVSDNWVAVHDLFAMSSGFPLFVGYGDAGAGDDALIIHTSGSSGVPKGVILQHGSIVSYLHNHNAILHFDRESVGMNNGPFHFDVSIQDMFLPIYFGARVVMHNDLFLSGPILALMRRESVTHLIAVSSVLALISEDRSLVAAMRESSLRVLMTGGEVCDRKLVDLWLAYVPRLRLFIGYGPTECNSICMAYHVAAIEADQGRPYPIGSPFKEHAAVLLGADGEILKEAGAVGVLAISGPQLMRNYWNRPAETARAIRHFNGRRWYVTGDYCSRDLYGVYHFIGRSDSEIKLRGRRIDLNEIRHALLRHSDVQFALAWSILVQSERRIYCAIVCHGPSHSHKEFEVFMRGALLDYMWPSYYFISSAPPKTSTGKLDEIALQRLIEKAIQDNPAARYGEV